MLDGRFPGGPVFEASPEPGPLSPDYTAPEPAAAEEAWSGPSQEEWERLNSAYDQIAELPQRLEQMMQQPQQPQQAEYPDPFADDYHQQLDNWFERKAAPLRYAQQTWEQSEGNERARDILSDNVSREGDFILEESTAKTLRNAELYLPEMQEKYGHTPEAAEAAINAAASDTRAYERAVGEAYHKQQMNQLKTLNDAPREPGAAVVPAVQNTGPPPGVDEFGVVAKYGGWGH